ncbi:hypothetical protein [Quadrisphaera sp. KR29]|uniref:hypothetical protein n=1 Tax=Quadrisphaera sp. KR29 TaxID=3461391 RepID=UPI004043FF9A
MAHTPARSGSQRLGARDRLWSGTRTSILLGPLHLPPADDLAAAAAVLADAFPASRLGHALGAGRTRWVPRQPAAGGPASRAALVVHDGPGPEEVGLPAFARSLEAHRTDEVPVRFVVAGQHLALIISHAAGDGALMLALPPALLEVARTGMAPAWTQEPATTAPLLRTLAHHYARHPGRVLATLAAVRAGRPAAAEPAVTAGGGEPPRRPLRPDTAVVHAVMDADRVAELTAWRRAQGAGTSTVAVQTVLVGEALRAVGLTPQGPPTVLVDARRYTPAGSVVHGNFVAGLQLPAGEPWDVRQLTAALRGAVDGARPLSAMALGAARQLVPPAAAAALRGDRDGGASRELVPARPRPVVAVTAMVHPLLEHLPWAGPAERAVATSVSTPAPAEGVTASFTDCRGHLNLSLSFHASVYDPGLLEEVLRLATSDPVAVLERAGHRGPAVVDSGVRSA